MSEQEPIIFPSGGRPRIDTGAKRVTFFQHRPHPHRPRNVNAVHKAEQTSLNARIALALTRGVGTMPTAYAFIVLAFVGLCGILGWLPPVALVLVAWFSQTFLQLVLLPVLAVGQNVLGRKQELQADEAFNTTQKSYSDIEQIMAHLSAQDEKILASESNTLEMLKKQDAHSVALTEILRRMNRSQ